MTKWIKINFYESWISWLITLISTKIVNSSNDKSHYYLCGFIQWQNQWVTVITNLFFFTVINKKCIYIYIYIYILLESKIGFHARCAVHSPYSHADNQALVNEFSNLKQEKTYCKYNGWNLINFSQRDPNGPFYDYWVLHLPDLP